MNPHLFPLPPIEASVRFTGGTNMQIAPVKKHCKTTLIITCLYLRQLRFVCGAHWWRKLIFINILCTLLDVVIVVFLNGDRNSARILSWYATARTVSTSIRVRRAPAGYSQCSPLWQNVQRLYNRFLFFFMIGSTLYDISEMIAHVVSQTVRTVYYWSNSLMDNRNLLFAGKNRLLTKFRRMISNKNLRNEIV